MIDTAAICGCCGKRESRGQCVKGQPMCGCERDHSDAFWMALECSGCSKCPRHCTCYPQLCDCKDQNLSFLGHSISCPAREQCRLQFSAKQLPTSITRVRTLGNPKTK